MSFTNQHNHEENSLRSIEVQKLRQGCKRRAADDLLERPSKIIGLELQNGTAEEGDMLPNDMIGIRRAVYRERRKKTPKLPKNREETHQYLRDYVLESSRGEAMIRVNDEDSGIIVFTARTNLEFLCNEDVTLFGDGTFNYCPNFFLQLYTLHGFKNGQHIPCVFSLLPNKSKDTYITMFRHLKRVCTTYGPDLNVASIHLDFEDAMLQAVKESWPNAIVKCCKFHLGQAWLRKIQALGLSDEYKTHESEVSAWLKSFFGLSFLPPADVSDAFAFDILADAPEGRKVEQFADYVLQTYVAPEAKFPPDMWADPDLESHRTTNACEAFHRHLGDTFYHPHPPIYHFMEHLKRFQVQIYIKLNAATTGVTVPVPRQRRLRLQEMHETRERFQRQELTTKEYIKRMAFKVLPRPL